MRNGLASKIHIDRSSSVPLIRQIRERIEELIRSGEFEDGHKLPSTRILSKKLAVNRATVAAAYRWLKEAELARTGVGSGTYVAYPKQIHSNQMDRSNQNLSFSSGAENMKRFPADLPEFGTFGSVRCNFATLVPDERLFPVKRFRECLDSTLERDGTKVLQYSGTMGHPALREMIAGMMSRQGRTVGAESILIVSGAQQGCDLVFRIFLSPGDRAIAGSPTYHNIYPLLGQMEAGLLPVPVVEEGLDIRALERAAAQPGARLIYTMPNFQNPTGVTATVENRKSLIEIARRANLPVLEDDYEGDLSATGKKAPSLHFLDGEGRVIHLGTFSKSLFPGLRVGWLAAAPEIIEMLAALKKATDLENSAMIQGALYEFCARGYYEDHLAVVRAAIRERMESAIEALGRSMPAGVTWSEPKGGYALWILLPPGVSSEKVYLKAGEEGVLVSPGTLFTQGTKDPGAIRISISRAGPETIREGIGILGSVIAAEIVETKRTKQPDMETPQHL